MYANGFHQLYQSNQENAGDNDEEFDVQQNTNYVMGVSSSEDEELSDVDDDKLGAISSNRTARTNRNTQKSMSQVSKV